MPASLSSPIPASSSYSPSPPPYSNPSSTTSPNIPPPTSILIVGSGVFGLSTALALSRRPAFASTTITVVDRSPDTALFPSRDASSVDTSRIIRADYADPSYAALAAEALVHWRKQDGPEDLGSEGRYEESSFILCADTPVDGVEQPRAGQNRPTKKTGLQYTRASFENVLSMAEQEPKLKEKLGELPNPAAIRDAFGTGGGSGGWGYLNGGSGWADADASMRWLLKQVKATGRVSFVSGTVVALETDSANNKVTGAKLADGKVLRAGLIILATGAWTGSLVDLTGRAVATGQVVGYMDITEEEQAQLSTIPVLLNLTTGLFVIPPRNRVLKFARHAYGYLNPIPAADRPHQPLVPPSSRPVETISLPWTHVDDPSLAIPAEGMASLRSAVREMIPSLANRPFKSTRLCWYTDTPTGDFIIDYHPSWKGLFLATGGSGHGFKFLPVIGEKIVDCVLGQAPAGFAKKWAWKDDAVAFKRWDEVVTEDGSRGGRPGLILRDELAKARANL